MSESELSSEHSYVGLAASRVPKELRALVRRIERVEPSIAPHEARKLRRRTGRVRDHLDLFSFAYPMRSEHGWSTIRARLSRGYRALGRFKDLHDEQGAVDAAGARYDEVEVEELRSRVLKWVAAMRLDAARDLAFVGEPLARVPVIRRAARSLWGDHVPRLHSDGRRQIARLLSVLAKRLAGRLEAILALEEIVGDSPARARRREEIHEYRKRLRLVIGLHGYFPVEARGGIEPTALMDALVHVVTEIGEIQDSVGGLRLREGDRRTRERELQQRWDSLRADMHREDVEGTLRAFARVARPRS